MIPVPTVGTVMALETSLTFCHFFRHYLNNGQVTHLYSSTIFTNSKTPSMARFWNNGIWMEFEDLILLKVTEDARIPFAMHFLERQQCFIQFMEFGI